MKKGLIQEWDIFRALCPELIMNKIINDDYSETDIMYIKLFLDNIKNEDIKNFFECKVC